METPLPEIAIREAIRHWRKLRELSELAVQRHGFGNTDGGFGIIYPGDLDEYDRLVDGSSIPEGFVQVYGFLGPPDGYELLVSESAYLTTLVEMLADQGYSEEAKCVKALLCE